MSKQLHDVHIALGHKLLYESKLKIVFFYF